LKGGFWRKKKLGETRRTVATKRIGLPPNRNYESGQAIKKNKETKLRQSSIGDRSEKGEFGRNCQTRVLSRKGVPRDEGAKRKC